MPRNPIDPARLTAAVLATGAIAVGPAGSAAAHTTRDDSSRPLAVAAAHAKRPTFSRPKHITNSWLPLSAYQQVVLTGTDGDTRLRSVRTRLKGAKLFTVGDQRVLAAIVEDRAYENDTLHKVTLDHYAQADDGTVHHLGKDVDLYDATGTRIVGHDGTFRYGRDTDVLGVAMPAQPTDGLQFTLLDTRGRDSERNRIADTNARLSVPKGTFNRVLVVHAQLAPDEGDQISYYARGVGLLKQQTARGALELANIR